MSDPIWLSYAGVITGSIGAITGIAGATMGYISYRRSGRMKALDLRLELRKGVNDLRSTVESLSPLIAQAKVSRTAVLAARGISRSSMMDQWNAECEKDLAAVKVLDSEMPDPNSSFEELTHSGLEARLVAVHSTQLKATRLSEKYRASLASDDKQREQISADNRANMQAMLGRRPERP